jgi:DNA-binding transcriptional ArsR family regulator
VVSFLPNMTSKRVQITVAVTPRFDLFYALYALADPAPSAVDGWKARATRHLPREFDAVARRIAPRPIFWPLLADTVQNSDGELTFDEIIAALSELSPEELRANILVGIFHDVAIVRALVSGKKNLRQLAESGQTEGASLLTHFGLRPYDARSQAARTISTVLTHPSTFRDELVKALRQFWETSFRSEWRALEGDLRADSLRMRELESELSPEDLASELRLPVTFDGAAKEMRPNHGPGIPYDRIDRCFVLPSAFNTRRWWAKYETRTGKVNLYFPVFQHRRAGDSTPRETSRRLTPSLEPGSIRAELVFRALGDTTRYAIASVLARVPTTSAELARSLGVSKPTITHHVQALRAAGLIEETPAGGSTKLALNRETLAMLSEAAVDQLFSGTGDLPLDTTRKRRTPQSLKKTS